MTQEPKLYEIAYVFSGTSEEAARTAATEQIKKYIEEKNGRSFEESRQMRRRLAYPIGKNHEGFFGNIKFFLKIAPTLKNHFKLFSRRYCAQRVGFNIGQSS